MDKISENYLEEQKRLHTNINYGTASLQHVNTIKNLLINTKLKTISDYGAGKKNLQKGLLSSGFTEFNYFASGSTLIWRGCSGSSEGEDMKSSVPADLRSWGPNTEFTA